MPGFGGSDCSLLAHGYPLIDLSQRATVLQVDHVQSATKTLEDSTAMVSGIL